MKMGLFHVAAALTGPTGLTVATELLVDTGATFLVLPRVMAERLELRPTRRAAIQIAGGREETWPLGEIRLTIDDVEVTTPCLVAPEGPALLGAVALESLLLAVDPVAKRLVPVKGFAGTTARRRGSAQATGSPSSAYAPGAEARHQDRFC